MKRNYWLILLIFIIFIIIYAFNLADNKQSDPLPMTETSDSKEITIDEREDIEKIIIDPSKYTKPDESVIKEKLTPLQYKVTQEEGTERAYDNAYYDNKDLGIYVDIVTNEPLFFSTDQYTSGTGWPSFTKPINLDVVTFHEDDSLFAMRTAIKSRVGNSHLGHVFTDGPVDEGGLRYCMNSAALKFIPYSEMDGLGYGDLMAPLDQLNSN